MVDQKPQSVQTSETFFQAFPALLQAGPQMTNFLAIAQKMHGSLIRTAVLQQKEAAAFLSQRCEEELKLADQISTATSPTDIVAACFGYWREAATQYAAEATRAAQLTSRSTLEVVEELRNGAKATENPAPEPLKAAA